MKLRLTPYIRHKVSYILPNLHYIRTLPVIAKNVQYAEFHGGKIIPKLRVTLCTPRFIFLLFIVFTWFLLAIGSVSCYIFPCRND